MPSVPLYVMLYETYTSKHTTIKLLKIASEMQ